MKDGNKGNMGTDQYKQGHTRKEMFTSLLKARMERGMIDGLPTAVLYDLWRRHCEKGQTLSAKLRKKEEAVKPFVPSVSHLHHDLEELGQ